MAARARSSVALAFPGVFERHTKLQERLEGIMNYESRKSRLGPWSWAFLVVFAVIVLPMAPVAQSPGRSQDSVYKISFQAVEPFHPADSGALLAAFNRNHPANVRTHHYRTRTDGGSLVGTIFVDGEAGRDAVETMLAADPGLELVQLVPARTGEWLSDPAGSGGPMTVAPETDTNVTYLVTFRALPPFAPQSARELLDAFNENHPSGVRTHHFRTEEGAGGLIGRILVDGDAGLEAIDAMFAASTKLALIDSVRATDVVMREHLGIAPDRAIPQGPPEIVASSPRIGETDVDPDLTSISVTFDQEMMGGFSWTGGPPLFPPGREGEQPHWSEDRRTCYLPVTLQPGTYYRVGINSSSYENFRSTVGIPARPVSIYFTTRGAGASELQKLQKPQVVYMDPPNGATDVDPNLTELRVTFSVPMGAGFSWTGGGPSFPKIPEGKRPYWTRGGLMGVLPVELEPGTTYILGLNSPSHINFQSEGGIPLDPVPYTFTTRYE
jgi:hypothetical protein